MRRPVCFLTQYPSLRFLPARVALNLIGTPGIFSLARWSLDQAVPLPLLAERQGPHTHAGVWTTATVSAGIILYLLTFVPITITDWKPGSDLQDQSPVIYLTDITEYEPSISGQGEGEGLKPSPVIPDSEKVDIVDVSPEPEEAPVEIAGPGDLLSVLDSGWEASTPPSFRSTPHPENPKIEEREDVDTAPLPPPPVQPDKPQDDILQSQEWQAVTFDGSRFTPDDEVVNAWQDLLLHLRINDWKIFRTNYLVVRRNTYGIYMLRVPDTNRGYLMRALKDGLAHFTRGE